MNKQLTTDKVQKWIDKEDQIGPSTMSGQISREKAEELLERDNVKIISEQAIKVTR